MTEPDETDEYVSKRLGVPSLHDRLTELAVEHDRRIEKLDQGLNHLADRLTATVAEIKGPGDLSSRIDAVEQRLRETAVAQAERLDQAEGRVTNLAADMRNLNRQRLEHRIAGLENLSYEDHHRLGRLEAQIADLAEQVEHHRHPVDRAHHRLDRHDGRLGKLTYGLYGVAAAWAATAAGLIGGWW